MATNECNCNNAAAEVKPVYYKDDLDFYMKLLDGEGNDIGLPDYDWSARLWTSSRFNYVTVSCIGGVRTNWRDEGDGRIHVVVDNHGLMPGCLHVDVEALLPNEAFADGSRRTVKAFAAPVVLTRECAPCLSAIEIEVMLPYIRGKALTFDDLTEEEKTTFAQQAADLVTIEDLGVASDEEVDEAMGKLLDTRPATTKKAFHLDRRIRRGIMPAKARPGIVYYDYGYIKISPYRGHGVYQLEWDLTAFQTVLDIISKIYILPIYRDSDYSNYVGRTTTVKGVGECLKEDCYEYDSISHKLKLNLSAEEIGMGALAVRYKEGTPAANSLSQGFIHREDDKVIWIGENGLLNSSTEHNSYGIQLGLDEYKPRPFNRRELEIIAKYLCGKYTYDEIKWQPGIGSFVFWKKKRMRQTTNINGKIAKMKWCRQMTKQSDKRYLYNTPKLKMGLVKIARKSCRGYQSEPVTIWIFIGNDTGHVHFSIID